MEHVLNAVNDKRASRTFGFIHESLQAEQICALGPGQRFKSAAESFGRQWIIEGQHERTNIADMPRHVIGVLAGIFGMAVMIALMFMMIAGILMLQSALFISALPLL